MSTRSYSSSVVQSQIALQSERVANSGIPGIASLFLKDGQAVTVRMLHGFSLAPTLYVHDVWAGGKSSISYACERNFNSDVRAYCPICQDFETQEHMKQAKARPVKHFLFNLS